MAALANCILLFCFISVVSCYTEQGLFELSLQKDRIADFQRTMYNQTKIIVKLECEADQTVTVKWWLWKAECLQAFNDLTNETVSVYKVEKPSNWMGKSFVASDKLDFDCSSESYVVSKNPYEPQPVVTTEPKSSDVAPAEPAVPADKAAGEEGKDKEAKPATDTKAARRKRETKRAEQEAGKAENAGKDPKQQVHPDKKEAEPMYVTKEDGIYLLLIEVDFPEALEKQVEMTVGMKATSGYLSPIDWPNLPFYGVMCMIYVVYGLVWLVMLGMNWRDLLRIQFWIGAVILLGMLEKACYFGEYESINSTGKSVRGALIFAELVSALKRSLARMLVIIVSLGYGIVKPRLGADQNKVVGVGVLFFILSSIEGCLRVTKERTNKTALMAYIPLSVLEAAICWWTMADRTRGKDVMVILTMVTLVEVYICYWIFTSLVTTTRTLRLRRNVVKLSLYRHFTNTLVFAVLSSLAFMIWSMSQHRFATCLSDWKELWVDEAFWHMLFCVILMVIIVLWRPSANNQRYAFSPLLDSVEEEDEDDTPMSDAFDGMKMRPNEEKIRRSGEKKNANNKVDDDLKWIDENIPASVADAALPSLLDSDEEIVTTKFEQSKME